MKLLPAVEKGFYFQCAQCGNCCSENTEGFIFIFPEDVEQLAQALQLPKKNIAEQYFSILSYEFRIWTEDLEYTGKREALDTLVFRTDLSEDCIFLEAKDQTKRCQIYDHRPMQCRTFPLWSMNMTMEEYLTEAMKNCKGIILAADIEQKKSINLTENAYISPKKIEENIRMDRKMEYEYYQLMKVNHFDITKIYPFLLEIKIPRITIPME